MGIWQRLDQDWYGPVHAGLLHHNNQLKLVATDIIYSNITNILMRRDPSFAPPKPKLPPKATQLKIPTRYQIPIDAVMVKSVWEMELMRYSSSAGQLGRT